MVPTHIPVICLTGGPCGGKSTILSKLSQRLADMGWHVIMVAEAATDFILGGLRPTPDILSISDFQESLMRYIIMKEDQFINTAQKIDSDKIVVICDRGVMDSAAYMQPHEFEQAIGRLGVSVVDVRDKRYDAVIFLRSLAYDKPDLYSCASNAARRESVDEAQAADERTLAAWTAHSHLKIIDNSTDLEGKVQRVLESVCRVLGIPAPLEIERKYKVLNCDIRDLPHPNAYVNITQYYLRNDTPGEIERIRSRSQSGGTVFYHTVKKEIRPGVRSEIERQITAEEYNQLLSRVDPRFGKICKTRYCFVWKDQYFEFDLFHSPSSLMLLEIELTKEDDPILLPAFLEDRLVDVTDDPEYSNYAIARRIGIPS
jgi:CYTH domain-containing protein/predicted ATPase